jgi:hypothetical protein
VCSHIACVCTVGCSETISKKFPRNSPGVSNQKSLRAVHRVLRACSAVLHLALESKSVHYSPSHYCQMHALKATRRDCRQEVNRNFSRHGNLLNTYKAHERPPVLGQLATERRQPALSAAMHLLQDSGRRQQAQTGNGSIMPDKGRSSAEETSGQFNRLRSH